MLEFSGTFDAFSCLFDVHSLFVHVTVTPLSELCALPSGLLAVVAEAESS